MHVISTQSPQMSSPTFLSPTWHLLHRHIYRIQRLSSVDGPNLQKGEQTADYYSSLRNAQAKSSLLPSSSFISSAFSLCVLQLFTFSRPSLKNMAGGHKIAHAVYRGPSVAKEIILGISFGLMAGGLWKMHHWNYQRKTREFYDLLEKGEISVVVEDE